MTKTQKITETMDTLDKLNAYKKDLQGKEQRILNQISALESNLTLVQDQIRNAESAYSLIEYLSKVNVGDGAEPPQRIINDD